MMTIQINRPLTRREKHEIRVKKQAEQKAARKSKQLRRKERHERRVAKRAEMKMAKGTLRESLGPAIPKGVFGYVHHHNEGHPTWNMVLRRSAFYDFSQGSPLRAFFVDVKRNGPPLLGILQEYLRRLHANEPTGDLQLIGPPTSGKTLLQQAIKLVLGPKNVKGWNRPTLWYSGELAIIDPKRNVEPQYSLEERPKRASTLLLCSLTAAPLHRVHNTICLEAVKTPLPFEVLYGRLEEERDAFVSTLTELNAGPRLARLAA
jgi:hypothetical protein